MLMRNQPPISNPIYRLRKAMGGISQDELGKKIGVGRAMIIRYEKGKSGIPDNNDLLTRLLKEYGISQTLPKTKVKNERAFLTLFNKLNFNEKIKVVRLIQETLQTSITKEASDAINGLH